MNAARAQVIGIKPWKRWQIDRFLRPRYPRLRYASSASRALRTQARDGGGIVVWAGREPAGFAEAAAARNVAVVRIEDGFLRSVGLGSNHHGGCSLVIDEQGIYFDPRTPSALERLIQTCVFDAALVQRAAQLRRFLVQSGVTKYNIGAKKISTVEAPSGRRKLLVVGQVEDDASIRLGAPDIHRNLDLLAQVRKAEPDAWIIYKPHPDTEAGTRAGRVRDADALRYADGIAKKTSAVDLFAQVDAVHTMTSLLGFEALLRGIAVTTWGLPFYAGWGLTHDRLSLPRRTRRPSLDELVAAALILYPSYVDPVSGAPCDVEHVARQLAHDAGSSGYVRRDSAAGRVARICVGLLRSWRSRKGA